MLVYVLVWAVPALFALSPVRGNRALTSAMFIVFGAALTMVIGLRDEIGADWYNYAEIHTSVNLLNGPLWLLAGDPAYVLLNRIFDDPEHGIYTVNLVCASLFVTGAVRFTRDQPYPALAVAILLAYLGIVVAMGYTRQSVAIGLVMFALVDLRRGRANRYFAVVVLAVLFHRSALVALPLGFAKASPALRWRAGVLMALAVPPLIIASLAAVQGQYDAYVVAGEQSGGGSVRVLMSAIPAAIFLGLRRRMRERWPDDADIWTYCSLFALALVPILVFASTAADRMGLYLVPLQIAVYSRLPLLLRGHWRAGAYAGALGLYGVTLGVWLTTSFFARCCWIPYKWTL